MPGNGRTLEGTFLVSGQVLSQAERDLVALLRDVKESLTGYGTIEVQVRDHHIETVFGGPRMKYTANEVRIVG